MGGEKSLLFAASRASVGSPPRGRGKGVPALEVAQHIGITPAWAGKSAGERQRPPCPQDHPRVGGEKSFISSTVLSYQGSPPHGRGKNASQLNPRP